MPLVKQLVISLVENHQILKIVIERVAVLMMDVLPRLQFAS